MMMMMVVSLRRFGVSLSLFFSFFGTPMGARARMLRPMTKGQNVAGNVVVGETVSEFGVHDAIGAAVLADGRTRRNCQSNVSSLPSGRRLCTCFMALAHLSCINVAADGAAYL